ncbi:MAG: alkaline phosphatase family protein [Planctomycetes bacterium]|nr:alkaline phosphatase family protein [Planctomycetota bacterium]
MRAHRALLLLAALAAGCAAPPAAVRRTRNVVLVTLDGARTQEVFGGVDLDVLRAVTAREDPKVKVEDTPAHGRYWAPTAEERRRKLLPFLWGTLLAEHGAIAGNRALGNVARVTNRHRFSYPGYAEILTGEAQDELIKSNDKVQSPSPTVLEHLRRKLGLDAKGVAAFCSWDVLDAIVEHERGAITANAGFEPYEHPDPEVRLLSRLQLETQTPWDAVRHDAYTFRFALVHLKTHRPRVLYIGLGETDDWSHDGRYDRYLQALERSDRFLKELWETLESTEEYRGRTSLVITTDHGRGDTPADWKDHGEKVEGAQFIWIAAAGPDIERRGEIKEQGLVHQSQVAATLCALLGIDYLAERPAAGKPIAWLLE